MITNPEIQEYLEEIREQVCSRCIERPPGGPPCWPLGKHCGIEMHLSRYVDAVHGASSPCIDPYLEKLKQGVCPKCLIQGCEGCPCPLDYLLVLTVRAIETVDQRREKGLTLSAQPSQSSTHQRVECAASDG
jgi:hypothetical protein